MDKVLILGINGFSGSHFQRHIFQRGLSREYSFIGIDVKGKCHPDIVFKKVDLLKHENLEALILDVHPDYIINLAGTFDCIDFDLMLKINANISRNICECVLRHRIPIKKILLIGSAAEYGRAERFPIMDTAPANPVNNYGLTKVIQTIYAEFYFNNFNLNVNVARTFNVIGKNISRALSIGAFIDQIKNAKDGDNIYVGNIDNKRDFLDIDDVIEAYWEILLKGRSGEIYNVCSGVSYSIKDLLNHLIEGAGKRLNIVVRKEYIKRADIMDCYGDNSKLMRDTNWKQKADIWESLVKLI